MYDPKTIAHEINFPRFWSKDFWTKSTFKYHKYIHLLTIWHVDPERRGSDDSCDWPGWRILRNKKIAKGLHDVLADAQVRAYLDHLLSKPRYTPNPKYASLTEMEPETAVVAIRTAAWWIYWHGYGKKLSSGLEDEMFRLATNTYDSLAGISETDRLLYRVALCMQSTLRPWWQHPRWHVIHLKWLGVSFADGWLKPRLIDVPSPAPIPLNPKDSYYDEEEAGLPPRTVKFPIPIRGWSFQVHHWQALKRMFTKCHTCGKRFSYGYSPLQAGGHRHPKTGKWVPHLHHMDCYRSGACKPVETAVREDAGA